MIRLRRDSVALSLLCATALLATHCGGDDDDSASSGARGGKAGAASGGKGGAAGRGGSSGSSGESGSNGEGGAGASPSSGGSGGTDATGGTSSPGGGAGDAGAPSEIIELTVADSATELIEADAGGTLTLGTLTLVIPPDALAEDTEITIRQFAETRALFALEPNGLEFETPITARFTFPASELEDPATEGVIPLFVLETGALDEPMELVSSTSVRLDEDDNYVAEGELSHFSGVIPRFLLIPGDRQGFVRVDDFTVAPAIVPIGVQFNTVASVAFAEPMSFDLDATAVGRTDGSIDIPIPVHVVPTRASADATHALGFSPVRASAPAIRIPLPDAPVPLDEARALIFSRQFECLEPGDGEAWMGIEVTGSFDATASGYRLGRISDGFFELLPGSAGTQRIEVTTTVRTTKLPVICLNEPSILTSLAPSSLVELVARFKAAWQEDCFWLSDHSSCKAPDPARAIVNVFDPVLEVGPDAAARIEAAFPCGDGPVGRTLCGTPGTFAQGDYVLVLATFGADIPLDDDTSLFQHAFVFDADGDTGNNYEPPPAYPDDFFLGTDKWYQLFYTPAQGFTMKVVDARISTSNAVSSNARLVVAGREFAAFIPRAELDGMDPGFRVTTFRHEGDYGLDGGPWDASYYPPLDEQLMPAAGGDVIVLPED